MIKILTKVIDKKFTNNTRYNLISEFDELSDNEWL